MTAPADIARELDRLGAAVHVAGGDLHVTAPAGAIPRELRERPDKYPPAVAAHFHVEAERLREVARWLDLAAVRLRLAISAAESSGDPIPAGR